MIVAPVRLLAGAMAALALVLVIEWTVPGASEPSRQAAVLHLVRATAKAPLVARAVATWTTGILNRPLFSASRRPPRITTGAHDDTGPGEARLSGIMISRYGRRAIFAPDGGGKPLVLNEGAPINESSIRRIEADKVILATGAVLRPAFDKNRVPSAYTPPPFQPVMPNFPNPAFSPGMPQPGFPRMPVQPQQPSQQENEPGQAANGDGSAAQPQPVFRGPNFPNRRE